MPFNQVPANHIGALEHQVDQPQYLLPQDIDSLPQQFLGSPQKTPVDGNIPNDVPARENSLGLWKYLNDDSPCLGDNIASNEKLFNITDFSPEWAYSTEHTKVCPFYVILKYHPCFTIVVYFHSNCSILMVMFTSSSDTCYQNHFFYYLSGTSPDRALLQCSEWMYIYNALYRKNCMHKPHELIYL